MKINFNGTNGRINFNGTNGVIHFGDPTIPPPFDLLTLTWIRAPTGGDATQDSSEVYVQSQYDGYEYFGQTSTATCSKNITGYSTLTFDYDVLSTGIGNDCGIKINGTSQWSKTATESGSSSISLSAYSGTITIQAFAYASSTVLRDIRLTLSNVYLE